MRWMRMAGGAAAIAAAMLLTSDVLAGKPGSGGGGAPPAGTIYAWGSGDLLAMDGNGANRTVLIQSAFAVRPSLTLHGGRRWFLTHEIVPGETVGGTARRDVFAVREDGALRVRLTSAPTMQYFGVAEWAPDEDASGATISTQGRRWTGLTSEDTVVDGTWGLYTAHLTFDGDGNVVGLDAEPTFAVFLGTKAGGNLPDVRGACSWSPDMTRLVADDWNGQIRVIDVASGDVVPLGPGEFPDWSPDGTKIAYSRFIPQSRPGTQDASALETVRPDGTGVTTVLSVKRRVSASTSQYVKWPRWSPDGAYLAYRYTFEHNGTSWTDHVYRVASNGTGITNLTPDVTPPSSGLSLVEWR